MKREWLSLQEGSATLKLEADKVTAIFWKVSVLGARVGKGWS